jgi:uncharacterized protein YhbP (UPF0306 family)
MDDQINEAAKVIKKQLYINLATITPSGMPWNTPVFTAYDNNLNFYWASWKKNQHSINIKNNPEVFATVYNSTVPAGTGFGVYFQGKAYELKNPKTMLIATKVLYKRSNKKPREIIEFLKNYPRRLYQFKPEIVWVNGDGDIYGNFIDIRTELDFEELKKLI